MFGGIYTPGIHLLDRKLNFLYSGVGPEAGVGAVKNPDSARKRIPRFSKSDHEALADIFKKIGQKELSKVQYFFINNISSVIVYYIIFDRFHSSKLD